MKWEPIETLPEEGAFLLYCEQWGHRKIQTAFRDKSPMVIGHVFAWDLEPPSHWMPAPIPPQAQGEIEEPKQSEGDGVDAPGTSASLTHNPEDLTRLITNLKSGVSYDPNHIASVIESLHAAYVEASGRKEQ